MRPLHLLLALSLLLCACKSKNKKKDLADEGARAAAVGAEEEAAPARPPETRTVAGAAPVDPPPAVEKKPLDSFLPARLGGLERAKLPAGMAIPEGHVIGAYLDMRTGRSINVNLSPVPDLGFARAQIKVLKPGEREDAGDGVVHMGFQVRGFAGSVSFYEQTEKSDARLLLAEAVSLSVSVRPADSHDEAVVLLQELDLEGIADAAGEPPG